MSREVRTQLAKEILALKWSGPTTDVMRGWNLALDSLVEYKLTNDIEKVVRCKDCKHSEEFIYPEGLETMVCWEDNADREVNRNGFCEKGERKDG